MAKVQIDVLEDDDIGSWAKFRDNAGRWHVSVFDGASVILSVHAKVNAQVQGGDDAVVGLSEQLGHLANVEIDPDEVESAIAECRTLLRKQGAAQSENDNAEIPDAA